MSSRNATVIPEAVVTIPNQVTSSPTSRWVMPLGQTPPYLDPQSQEALYEVDVSGMPLNFAVNRHQMDRTER